MGGIAGGFLGYFGDAVAGWIVDSLFAPSPSLKVDFQASMGCPSGKLTDIRRFAENQNLPLTNGADRLIICDSEALETIRSRLPRDLAGKYPACLRWIDGGLLMLRASSAVCALPGNRGFVCDGANARIFPGVEAIGSGNQVGACSESLLSQFGFSW